MERVEIITRLRGWYPLSTDVRAAAADMLEADAGRTHYDAAAAERARIGKLIEQLPGVTRRQDLIYRSDAVRICAAPQAEAQEPAAPADYRELARRLADALDGVCIEDYLRLDGVRVLYCRLCGCETVMREAPAAHAPGCLLADHRVVRLREEGR